MHIELKNIKIHADMSEETTCFSASIYLNGKKVGTAKNDGRGGSNMYWWDDREAGMRVHAWAQEQPTEYDFEKLDQVIGCLLETWAKEGVARLHQPTSAPEPECYTVRMESELGYEDFEYSSIIEAREGMRRLRDKIRQQADGITRTLFLILASEDVAPEGDEG